MNGIEVKGVSKNFGSLEALKNVNVCFEENRIYGLLGRNGAGKSTLLNVITGRIFAEQGEVTVDGEVSVENDRALKNIYMMSEKNYFPDGMPPPNGPVPLSDRAVKLHMLAGRIGRKLGIYERNW